MRDADVLGFIHDGEVERRTHAAAVSTRQNVEESRVRNQFLRFQGSSNLLKDGPKNESLRFFEPRLATQTNHIAIVLPCIQLPRIDSLLTFCGQKLQRELIAIDRAGGRLQASPDSLSRGNLRLCVHLR